MDRRSTPRKLPLSTSPRGLDVATLPLPAPMAPCVGLPAKGKLAPHVSGGIDLSARQVCRGNAWPRAVVCPSLPPSAPCLQTAVFRTILFLCGISYPSPQNPPRESVCVRIEWGVLPLPPQAPVRVALPTAFLLAAACLCGLEGRGRDLTVEGYFRASFSSPTALLDFPVAFLFLPSAAAVSLFP